MIMLRNLDIAIFLYSVINDVILSFEISSFILLYFIAAHLRREKRAIPRNTCQVIAIADYSFFKGPGGGQPHRAANYIVS